MGLINSLLAAKKNNQTTFDDRYLFLTGGQSNARSEVVYSGNLGNIYFCDLDTYTNTKRLFISDYLGSIEYGFLLKLRDVLPLNINIVFARVAIPGLGINPSQNDSFNVNDTTGAYNTYMKYSANSIYANAFNYIQKNADVFLWTHGEQDTAFLYEQYDTAVLELITALKSDYSNFYFLMSDLQPFNTYDSGNVAIMNTMKDNIVNDNPSFNRRVSTENLTHIGDFVHYTIDSRIELGKRYAINYMQLKGWLS